MTLTDFFITLLWKGKKEKKKRKTKRKKILLNISSFFVCVFCVASLKHSDQENFFFPSLYWWFYVEIPLFWGMLLSLQKKS